MRAFPFAVPEEAALTVDPPLRSTSQYRSPAHGAPLRSGRGLEAGRRGLEAGRGGPPGDARPLSAGQQISLDEGGPAVHQAAPDLNMLHEQSRNLRTRPPRVASE